MFGTEIEIRFHMLRADVAGRSVAGDFFSAAGFPENEIAQTLRAVPAETTVRSADPTAANDRQSVADFYKLARHFDFSSNRFPDVGYVVARLTGAGFLKKSRNGQVLKCESISHTPRKKMPSSGAIAFDGVR